MLNLNPNLRISAPDALNDPWIQKNTNEIPLNAKCLQNLSQFSVINLNLFI